MKIERLRIRNFRLFKDVDIANIPQLAIFIGANGTGKSTLFDVLAFLRDSLQDNVHIALTRRGGFREVISRGVQDEPIQFEIKFRDNQGPLVTYQLHINQDKGRGIVEKEVLKYRRGQYGQPWHFLDFQYGEGTAITNETDYGTPDTEIQREDQKLDSPDILAIKGLGQFQRFQVVSQFRRLIERWHLSNFHIQAARTLQDVGRSEHLSPQGENLPQVTQFLYENYRERFNLILERMKQRIPGISHIEATETIDGRLVLRFQDGTFQDPFIARYVSDGTLKMFAYLLLLYDPSPHPLLCVEEPENQLYPALLMELLEEFRDYGQQGGQVWISTHSPEMLNAADIDEVFWLEKNKGFTQVYRANSNKLIKNLVKEGDALGALWKQGIFEQVHS